MKTLLLALALISLISCSRSESHVIYNKSSLVDTVMSRNAYFASGNKINPGHLVNDRKVVLILNEHGNDSIRIVYADIQSEY